MQQPAPRLCLHVLGIAAVLLASALPAQAKPYEETEKKHSWFSFSRPHEKNPADQLAYANALREAGSLRRAGRHYRALAQTWPGSPEAPAAQLAYARTLDTRGKIEDAFDEYQALMEKYSGRFAYAEVLGRQFEIACALGNRRRLAWFGLPGFLASERAVPLLEKVIQNGPQGLHAAEAQFLIGKAYEDSKQEDLAVTAYLLCEERYPGMEQASRAALGRARCWHRLSEETSNDESTLEEAYAAATIFVQRYADHPEVEQVRAMQQALLGRRARMAYDRAQFYDRIAHKPAAALQSYRSFIRMFPASEHVADAKTRMRELEPNKEQADEPST